jgi:uncharacterized protein YjbI with pentapeptide repeats
MAAAYAGALSWAKMRIDLGRAGPWRATAAGWIVALLCLPVAWLTAANSKGIWEVRVVAPRLHIFSTPPPPENWAQRVEAWARRVGRNADADPLQLLGLTLWSVATDLMEIDPADLSGVSLSALPPEHADRAAARARYRAEWCARSGLDAGLCGDAESAGSERARGRARAAWCAEADIPAGRACDDHFARLDAAFEAEWSGYRAAILAQIDKPSLAGRDLRGADLSNASLLGFDFRGADLRGADLSGAQMEEADLSGAQMEGAFFFRAQMEGADLSFSQMEGADLSFSQMEGANLSRARMEGADLRGAQMEGADLTSAQMERADWRLARIMGSEGAEMRVDADLRGVDAAGAALRFVDLTEATSSPSSDFRNAFGDATVRLPIPDADRPCHWPDAALSDAEFYGRWRGWVEFAPGRWGWISAAPPEYHDVTPIPPDDPDCRWHE